LQLLLRKLREEAQIVVAVKRKGIRILTRLGGVLEDLAEPFPDFPHRRVLRGADNGAVRRDLDGSRSRSGCDWGRLFLARRRSWALLLRLDLSQSCVSSLQHAVRLCGPCKERI